MSVELVKDLARIIYPGHTLVVTIEHPGRHKIDLDVMDKFEAIFVDAAAARKSGQEETATKLYTTAAHNAVGIFDSVSADNMTAKDRRLRTECGEFAVVSLLEAGRNTEAQEFGQRFIQDPLVRAEAAARVEALITPSPVS